MARDPSTQGRNRFGPQEPQADLPENRNAEGKPRFYLCGICEHLHPASWDGDCRDDNNRFTYDELDKQYGEQDEGWECVPTPGTDVYEDEDENASGKLLRR